MKNAHTHSHKHKPTRKEIMRMKRRRRELRLYTVTAVFATLCVFAIASVVIMAKENAKVSGGEWIMADAQVEIAAPASNPGGAVIIETSAPQFPQAYTPGPTARAVPVLTAEPTDEPTPEPSAEATAEPAATATAAPESTPEPSAEPEMAELEAETMRRLITITAAGDCTLGGDYNSGAHARFDGYADDYGYDYFFENVRDIFEADDLTFVNLEGPLTDSENKRSGRIFNFKGDTEYTAILSGSSVELAGLANNHSLDWGTEGLLETAEVLEADGVGYCGYKSVWHGNIKGFDIACLSVTEWDYTIDELKEMLAAERESCDLLIVMIHWGEEREYSATDSQEEYGRALIVGGADLVLGSHSHVVGGIEEYNGKYIVYGLGNFCFGGNKNPGDKDCLIFQQTFEMTDDGRIADAGITVIPCSVSSASNTNDYRPTPLEGTEAARVLRKIGRYSALDTESVLWSPAMDEYIALLKAE